MAQLPKSLLLVPLLAAGALFLWLPAEPAGPDPIATRPTGVSSPLKPPARSPLSDLVTGGERKSLGRATATFDAPAPTEPASPPAFALRLSRWPDGAPLRDVRAQVIGHPAVPRIEGRTNAHGLFALPPVPAGTRLALRAQAEHYESGASEWLHEDQTEHELQLRPTRGHYGRVVDAEGGPVEGHEVRGWWVETPRPFGTGSSEAIADKLAEEENAARAVAKALNEAFPSERDWVVHRVELGGERIDFEFGSEQEWELEVRDALGANAGNDGLFPDVDPIDPARLFEWADSQPLGALESSSAPPPAPRLQPFLAGRAEVRSTAPTNADGWYYLEPPEAHVLGKLKLAVEDDESATELASVAMPYPGRRLPDLVLHRREAVFGAVVDARGRGIAGARVIVQRRGGWSPEFEGPITNEAGEFELLAPIDGVEVGVEAVGYRLTAGGHWKPAAGDGMREAWVALVGERARGERLFHEAYAAWRDPLPRERHFHVLEPLGPRARLVLQPLPSLIFDFYEVDERVAGDEVSLPVEDVRATMHYGGVANTKLTREGSREGRVSFPDADRDWQPMLLHVSAPGFASLDVPLPPGRLERPWRMRMTRSGAAGPAIGEGRESDPVRAILLDSLGRGVEADVALYRATDRKPFARARSDRQGELRFPLPDPDRQPIFELEVLFGQGDRWMGAVSAPIVTSELVDAPPIEIVLEDPVPVTLRAAGLDEDLGYRVSAELRSRPWREGRASFELELPRAHERTHDALLHLPPDWLVAPRLEARTRGNTPNFDFRDPLLNFGGPPSMRFTSSHWETIAAPTEVGINGRAQVLLLWPEPRIAIGGELTGRAPFDDRRLFVLAQGPLGQWVAPVDGLNWFSFDSLPRGKTTFSVFAPPSDETGDWLEARGEVLCRSNVELLYSRFDLRLKMPSADNVQRSSGPGESQDR